MLLNLPTRSLEAFVEAEDNDGSRRLERLERGKSQIPWMLCTIAHYREESGHIRSALARMSAAHREVQRSA